MTLQNKIIAALSTVGILVGTYVVGSTDIVKCLQSQHVIDVDKQVRLCLDDNQYAILKADKLSSLLSGHFDPAEFPTIAAVVSVDSQFATDVQGELISDFQKHLSPSELLPLHVDLFTKVPSYAHTLAAVLVGEYISNKKRVNPDDYPLYVATINALLKENPGSVYQVNGPNLFDKLENSIN